MGRIDTKHPSLQNHAPHLTISQEEIKASKKASREAVQLEQESGVVGTAGSNKGKSKEIPIEELWKPSSNSIPFWEACGLE